MRPAVHILVACYGRQSEGLRLVHRAVAENGYSDIQNRLFVEILASAISAQVNVAHQVQH